MTYPSWPWGDGDHEKNYGIDKPRIWCFDCSEWCCPPSKDTDLEFVCRCCREPLYQLRIAELEHELAKFQLCEYENSVCLYHIKDRLGFVDPLLRVHRSEGYPPRKVYHKEGE